MAAPSSPTPAPRPERAPGSLVLAWLATALVAVAVPCGIAVSTAYLHARGYEVDQEEPPGLGLTAFLLLAMVVAVPTAVAAWLGRRAARAGHPSGTAAAVIALVIGGGVVLTGLPIFLSRVLGWPVVLAIGAVAAMVVALVAQGWGHRHPSGPAAPG